MNNQQFDQINWPTICKSINEKMEPLFGGHNYVFRPDGDGVLFIASEQRLPHAAVKKVTLPEDVVCTKTSTGATKIVAKNPLSIFKVVEASVQFCLVG
ncbi:MAG: hypothetical protein ACOZAJ_03410 [Patescibacteria group bacterium]